MRECGSTKRLPWRAGGEQHRGGRGGLTDADRRHVGLDVLDRVVDREETRDLATGRVDVDRDVLVGVFALEVQELRHHQVGDRVVDRRAEEDDALLEETRVDVERPLTAVRLLDDGGDEVVADGLAHDSGSSSDSSAATSASAASGASWVGARLGQGEVDGVAVRVDHFGVVHEELQGLRPCDVRAYRLENTAPFEILPNLGGLLVEALGDPLDLGGELVVGGLDLLLDDHGPQREVGADRLAGRLAQGVDELLLVLAGHGQVLRDRQALHLLLEAVRHVVQAALHLLVDERVGDLDRHQAGGLVEDLLAHLHAGLHPAVEVEAGADVVRSASTVSNSLTSPTHSSVSSGSTFFLVSFTSTRKETASPACSPKRSGSSSSKRRMSPGFLPCSSLSSFVGDDARADRVEVVGGAQALDVVAGDRAGDVDLGVVAVGERGRRSRRGRRSGRAAGRPARRPPRR